MSNTSSSCEFENCKERVAVAIIRVLEGSLNYRPYCPQHSENALQEFELECENLQVGSSHHVGRCAVQVASVICDAREGRICFIGLLASDSTRSLIIPTGTFEAWMLAWELRRQPTPAIGTHQAMVRMMHTLQGELQQVTIDDISPGPVFHCHANILQGGTEHMVKMRASDAVILAVICNSPIMVERPVWESLHKG